MQSAAKQVLGQEAMMFAPWHKHPICVAACREAGIFDADKQFFWHPDNANETISIDALTVDPSKLVEGLEGIWDTAEKTLEQPILETRLHNTRPGEAPDVQAWLVVSAEFGAMVFFPRLGTKGGPEGAHDGCEWWYSQLTAAQLQLLKDMKYYNRDKALKANKEVAAKIQKQVEAGQAAGVDPTLFLVRPLQCQFCASADKLACLARSPSLTSTLQICMQAALSTAAMSWRSLMTAAATTLAQACMQLHAQAQRTFGCP